MGKHGKFLYLALCRVQCGRVYETGTRYHTRKLEDRLPEGFDSGYDGQQCCYRLSQANLQLALLLYTLEILVKVRQSHAEMPLYWSPDVAVPFGLVPVATAEVSALKAALLPGGSLGGRDRREDGDYSGEGPNVFDIWMCLDHFGPSHLLSKFIKEKFQSVENNFLKYGGQLLGNNRT